MASGSLSPLFLSASVNGEAVLITAGVAPGDAVHTPDSGTQFMHEVTITPCNNSGTTVIVRMQVGSDADSVETVSLGANRNATFPKFRITGGIPVTMWHEGGSGVTIAVFGIVNQMEL